VDGNGITDLRRKNGTTKIRRPVNSSTEYSSTRTFVDEFTGRQLFVASAYQEEDPLLVALSGELLEAAFPEELSFTM
jgi:hypothetical protein